MFERFSTATRQVIVATQVEVSDLGHERIGPHHLVLGLFRDDGIAEILEGFGVAPEAARERVARMEGIDATALDAIGIDLEDVRRRVEQTFGPGALDRPGRRRRGFLPFTDEAKRVLENSLRELLQLGGREIRPEHVLLGVVRTGGEGTRLLEALGVDLHALRAEVVRRLNDQR